eukprot:1156870-Pelagomonas_calceolata.AAC.2
MTKGLTFSCTLPYHRREYRAMLDADRAKRLSRGTNHPKEEHKKKSEDCLSCCQFVRHLRSLAGGLRVVHQIADLDAAALKGVRSHGVPHKQNASLPACHQAQSEIGSTVLAAKLPLHAHAEPQSKDKEKDKKKDKKSKRSKKDKKDKDKKKRDKKSKHKKRRRSSSSSSSSDDDTSSSSSSSSSSSEDELQLPLRFLHHAFIRHLPCHAPCNMQEALRSASLAALHTRGTRMSRCG